MFYKYKEGKIHNRIGGNYGLIVEINGGIPGRTIALRADFDALNIDEETGLAFSSKHKGWMHACGHDRSEEHTSELQSRFDLVCRLLLEKKNNHAYVCRASREADVDHAYGLSA